MQHHTHKLPFSLSPQSSLAALLLSASLLTRSFSFALLLGCLDSCLVLIGLFDWCVLLGGSKGAHHDKPAALAPKKWVGKGPAPPDWNKEQKATAAPAPKKWVGKGPPPADWNKEAVEAEGVHLQVHMSFHSLAPTC